MEDITTAASALLSTLLPVAGFLLVVLQIVLVIIRIRREWKTKNGD